MEVKYLENKKIKKVTFATISENNFLVIIVIRCFDNGVVIVKHVGSYKNMEEENCTCSRISQN